MKTPKVSSIFWSFPAFLVLSGLIACLILIPLRGLAGPGTSVSAGPDDAKERPYVIEYYYKTKWGHADEFLWMERGRIVNRTTSLSGAGQ